MPEKKKPGLVDRMLKLVFKALDKLRGRAPKTLRQAGRYLRKRKEKKE